MKNDHGRGKINDNALAALVTSKTFKAKVQDSKKARQKHPRKMKHKGKRFDDCRKVA